MHVHSYTIYIWHQSIQSNVKIIFVYGCSHFYLFAYEVYFFDIMYNIWCSVISRRWSVLLELSNEQS